MSFLVLDRLTKHYGGTAAVDQLSLSVEKGEFVSLLGPSGCGKTTTLQMIAGFVEPSAGAITLDGTDLLATRPAKRGLGIVFQSYALFPHMSAAENVAFGLEMQGVARAERARRVAEALSLVGLAALADRYPRSMSGGQQQRVALARALVIRPRMLLLDEPLSNLDAKLRLRLRDDLRVILKQTGMTALYVTHDQAEAVVLGDRIGVMRNGKLLQMDTPDEIYNRPADLFVANFTGATNELEGRLVSRNGEFGMVDFGEGRQGEVALLHSCGPDDKVRIALRPENITIGANNGANHFPARVLDRRYQGTQTAYGIELFGKRLEVVELGTAARHQVGIETQVSLPRESCWAYRDTGPVSHE
jgi:iron(III) transport system ATP-binding protein